ncbi:hypothetical protein GO285_01275 [Ralstonia solanacearum]|nr:hypothetical protein [Ralstonia solanacearum]NKF94193.1 hypothetical protein [Ralstonia solanacearum]NKG09541.1 hypothetical protein [Ralstonia solanacearum]
MEGPWECGRLLFNAWRLRKADGRPDCDPSGVVSLKSGAVMGRSSRPRKTYRRRTHNAGTSLRTQPWLLDTTFGPLREVLEHIARGGELHETDHGALIYVSPVSHKPYEVAATIRAYVEIFTVLRSRDSACPDMQPLRQAMQDINGGEVSEAVVMAALECLTVLRSYAAGKPAEVIADAAQSVLLRLHMDAAEKRTADSVGDAEVDGRSS